MTVYLIRHAKAGSRRNWSGEDARRPLSPSGLRQAAAIADAIADTGVTRIVSSPFVRCVQTVEPLAMRIGVPVDVSDALAESAPLADAVALLDKLAREDVVLCSHGDVLGDLLMHLADHGIRIETYRLEKASTWKLETARGVVTTATYLPPPK